MFALDSARVAGNTRGSLPAHCLLIECRNDNLQDPLWRARANNILAAELTNFVADVATD